MGIEKPKRREELYFTRYIDKVKQIDFLEAITYSTDQINNLFLTISEEKSNFAYAEGKWTIKQVLTHIIDTERVLMFRALAFSRKESKEFPGFDQDSYAIEEDLTDCSLKTILKEYNLVRASTVLLYQRMKIDNLDFAGRAGGQTVSARELGFTIAGHDLHHLEVIKEKYLK